VNINKEVISKFNPCKERFDMFLENYSDFNGSFDEFIDLNKITYEDKIWVAKKVLNRNQLVHFGLLCAKSVLNIFETKYPEDKTVSDCIRYLESIPNFNNLSLDEKEMIRSYRDAVDSAADSVSYVASASAAAYAAAAAADIAYVAAYADAAYDAAYAAAHAAAREQQLRMNLEFLKMAASL
jgi:hypothetical protein